MHLEKLPSGRWRVTVQRDGQRRRITRDTEGQARHIGAEMYLELGARQTRGNVTVGDLIDQHLATAEWSPTTLADARRVADKLPKVFQDRLVADVDAPVLAALYRQLDRDGWSRHRIQRAHVVISTSWKQAIEYGWANRNPARDVKPPKRAQPEVRPPTGDEVRRILSVVDGKLLTYFRLAGVTGARRGELLALQRDVLDLERGSLIIRRSIVLTVDSGIHVRETKTGRKGHRVLSLDDGTLSLLKSHLAEQSEHALAAGLPTPVWVFSHDAGVTPWRPDYISREFRRACDRAGVTGVRLHDLRHYVATTMLYDGDSLHEVAARLGHASTATTASVYGNWVIGQDRESADRLARRLG